MIESAKFLAFSAHSGQKYGDAPYTDHLADVVRILEDAGITNEEKLAAGWLHDVVEDTDITLERIVEQFDHHVAQMVWACTGVGINRKARNASIYEKIARYSDAADIKVADRIANVEHAAHGSSHKEMYLKEREAFEGIALYAEPTLWRRLQRAYQS